MTNLETAITSSKNGDALLLGACCTTLATLVPVALYQTGLLPSLPDPPSAVFDSDKIASSKAAHPFGVPDGLLGIASFGTTLSLILLARRSPTARKLLGAKLSMDASAAAFNSIRQVVGFGKLCSWCTGTAIAAAVMAYAGRNVIKESYLTATAVANAAVSAHQERV